MRPDTLFTSPPRRLGEFRRVRAGLAGALFALATAACATTVPMQPTTLNPGSHGKVSARETANGNTRVTVEVAYLPPPERLAPELNTYVVWLRPAGSERYLNAGQVKIDDDRRGSITTTTPYEDFFVVVTAESVATVAEPSAYVMLQAPVEQP